MMETIKEQYRLIYTIRRFEETVLDNFSKGVFQGTTHTYIGQEANAAGVIPQLCENDIIFSNHRCHGHFIAYGGSMEGLFAEMMGKPSGICGGRGGSQHIHWKNFYSNGVQGSIVPVAAGTALAEKEIGSGTISVVFLGDGTLGEGVVYETLNIASLWGLPILFVLEDNGIAQTTPGEKAIAGSMKARFEAFGIKTDEQDSSDVSEISLAAKTQIHEVRKFCSPRALILHTCRFGPHSKGDDTRDEAAVREMLKTRDPLKIAAFSLSPDQKDTIEKEVEEKVAAAFKSALAAAG
ncbi:MAG: thiamine pyrophosphate-dependent dehydrogenase E1 component subunit alpha [Anaerolineales bacterium]|nr:thiamine pyrophosphate-dependent dehydrogenase E1 component subunit alpha [Anaerolineales bacterium]